MRFEKEMLKTVLKGRTIYNSDVSDITYRDLQVLEVCEKLVNDPNDAAGVSWLDLAMLAGREGLDYRRFPSSEGDTLLNLMDSAFAERWDLVGKAKHLVGVFGVPTIDVYRLFTTRWCQFRYEAEFLALKDYWVSLGVNPPKYDSAKHDGVLGPEMAQKIFS